MPRMSQSEYETHLAQSSARRGVVPDAVEKESDLHALIIEECKRRGWKYVHSPMNKASLHGQGVCDFIIYANLGRMLNVECKSKSGKLSMEQMAFSAWLAKLGHAVHEVRNFTEFLMLCDLKIPTRP